MPDLDIHDVTLKDVTQAAFCGYKNPKSVSLRSKVAWLSDELVRGTRHKLLLDEKGDAVGGIEYAPAEEAWKPVHAPGYFVVNCIYIMKKELKGHGYGAGLLQECLEDAKEAGALGVAAIARKETWMPDGRVFSRAGFTVVDTAPPDFELWALSFHGDRKGSSEEAAGAGHVAGKNGGVPAFSERAKAYAVDEKGWVIYWSDQCPYLAKCVPEILATAKKDFGIEPQVVKIESAADVRQVPCAFGTFCITFDGKVVADRPVSKSRFRNIVNSFGQTG